MAFENGYNMFDYCFEIFKHYKEDDTIFMKALPILYYFQEREDYPYCLRELDKAFKNILGESLTDIAYCSGKYIELEEMHWNVNETGMGKAEKIIEGLSEKERSRLARKFEREFKAFCITIRPALNEIFMMENHPMRLKQLTYQRLFGDEGYNIRIIRNDNKKLDLIAKEEDIKFLIDSLKRIESNED